MPLYAVEQVIDVSGCHYDGGRETRQVKVFVKGPSRGVGPHTRILIHLHGLGGRNHNIFYKRFRRDISDELDCIVVGVDFFGTKASWIDPVHYKKEEERLWVYIRDTLLKNGNGQWSPEQGIFVKPSSQWFTVNEYSAEVLGQSTPEDCWDYGAIQALDVLAGIRWLLDDLRKNELCDQRTIHILAKSSGCQVAACLVKIVPNLIASVVEVGPMIFAAQERESLAKHLTDPIGDDATGRVRVMPFRHEVTAYVLRKLPVLLPVLPLVPPELDDHIELRLLDSADQWVGIHSPTVIMSIQGDQDPAMSVSLLEDIQKFRRHVGMECTTDIIRAEHVDGKIFTGIGHDVAEDMLAFQRYIAPRMMNVQTPAPWPETWLVRRLPSRNGTWIITWEPRASLSFIPTRST